MSKSEKQKRDSAEKSMLDAEQGVGAELESSHRTLDNSWNATLTSTTREVEDAEAKSRKRIDGAYFLENALESELDNRRQANIITGILLIGKLREVIDYLWIGIKLIYGRFYYYYRLFWRWYASTRRVDHAFSFTTIIMLIFSHNKMIILV